MLLTALPSGMVELVPDCCTLREIQSAVGPAGVFRDEVLKDWLEKQNPSEFQYKIVIFQASPCSLSNAVALFRMSLVNLFFSLQGVTGTSLQKITQSAVN